MIKKWVLFLLLLVLFAFSLQSAGSNPSSSATVARPAISCGDTITQNTHGKIVKLTNNDPVVKNTCKNAGLLIGSNGVTLDCQKKSIQGSATGNGISLKNRKKVTVKNCAVDGFSYGIVESGGTENRFEENILTNNKMDILIDNSKSDVVKKNFLQPTVPYTEKRTAGISIKGKNSASHTLSENDLIRRLINAPSAALPVLCSPNNRAGVGNYYLDVPSGEIVAGSCGAAAEPFTEQGMVATAALNSVRPLIVGDLPPVTLSCGQRIRSGGGGTLAGDVGPCLEGDGLVIEGNDVTLKCDRHKIIGPGGFEDAESGPVGITITGNNARISGCTIEGFRTGIKINGDNSVVKGNIFDHLYKGIDINADNVAIEANHFNAKRGVKRNSGVATVIQFNIFDDKSWSIDLDNPDGLRSKVVMNDFLHGASEKNVIGADYVVCEPNEVGGKANYFPEEPPREKLYIKRGHGLQVRPLCGYASFSWVQDTDGDGAINYLDNCLSVRNNDQRDTNGDGAGDACDSDNDGIDSALDNCPEYYNPLQENRDALFEVCVYDEPEDICNYHFTDDKEGDACDGNDFFQGLSEASDTAQSDCGGSSSRACISCDWCNELTPLRLGSYTNSIDVVFVPEGYSGTSERTSMLVTISQLMAWDYNHRLHQAVQNSRFSTTRQLAGLSLPEDFIDHFNFYLLDTTTASGVDVDDVASWADIVHYVHKEGTGISFGEGGYSSGLGPPAVIHTTEPTAHIPALHELGHGLFGLGDEYDLESVYAGHSTIMAIFSPNAPNWFGSLEECRAFATTRDWPDLCNNFFHAAKYACYEYPDDNCIMGNFNDFPYEAPESDHLPRFGPASAVRVLDVFYGWPDYNSFDPGTHYEIHTASSSSAVTGGAVSGSVENSYNFLQRLKNFFRNFRSTGQAAAKTPTEIEKKGMLVVVKVKGEDYRRGAVLETVRSKVVIGYHQYQPCTGKCFRVEVLSSSGTVKQVFSIGDPRFLFDGPVLPEAELSVAFPLPIQAADVAKVRVTDMVDSSKTIIIDLLPTLKNFCKTYPKNQGCKGI